MFSFRGRLIVVVLTLGLMAWAPLASAQLSSLGPTFTGPAGQSGGLNDAAYDDVHDVYLHVYGGTQIFGQFVNTAGQPVGPRFAVTNAPITFANWLHVAYSQGGPADVFMVTFGGEWAGNNGKSIFGQLVRFNGGGGELVGGTFPVSELGITKNIFQSSGGIAYNHRAQKFLVTWEDVRGSWDVFVRVYNTDGSPASGEINVTANGQTGDGQPNVAYDWQQNRFLLVYKSWASVGPVEKVGSYAVLLDGNTGQPITGRITVNEGFYRQELPGVLFLPEVSSYLVYWMDEVRTGAVDILVRLVDANGTPTTNSYPALTPGWNGVPDADYDAVSRMVLLAGQHDSGYVYSGLLAGNGAVIPGSTFQGSTVGWSKGGTYTPQVIAADNGQFGVGYVVDYASAWLERWQAPPAGTPGPTRGGTITPPPPPPPPVTIDLSSAPNGSWFFAEGVASGEGFAFDTKYILANESDAPITVRGYFARSDGQAYEKLYDVGARSRKTVSLRDSIGNGAYSAVFQSMNPGQQVFASRSVVWGAGGYGSTAEVATTWRSRTWFFGEGSRISEFFQNFFLVFNPGQADANVTFKFFKPDGSTPTRTAVVKAQSRYTLWANTLAELANSDFSLRIDADQEIIAERAMYWGKDFEGGHDSLGAPSTNNSWYFAEGAAAEAFDTFYTILNPTNGPIWVDIKYFLDPALRLPPLLRSHLVQARSRYTVRLNTDLGNVGAASALLVSRGGEQFVAERSIYWGRSQWIDGTNVVGAMIPAMIWHLPGGSLENGVDHYVLLANPNQFDVQVDIALYVEGGGRFTSPRRTIPAGSRVTVHMRTDFTSDPTDRSLLDGRRYTVKVESKTLGGPIFAEEATYTGWTGLDYWRAGAAGFGIPQ